jgi:hypothetical protein
MPAVTAAAVVAGACVACGLAVCSALAGAATIGHGQTRTWTSARMPPGARVSCGSHGVRAVARVPPPGTGVSASADGPYGAAELRLWATRTGLVVAACR